MKVFVNPHSGAEIDSWNITGEEPEQITVVRNGRAYVLSFEDTPVLEVWSIQKNDDFDKILHTVKIPVIEEQLEFDFVKNL